MFLHNYNTSLTKRKMKMKTNLLVNVQNKSVTYDL